MMTTIAEGTPILGISNIYLWGNGRKQTRSRVRSMLDCAGVPPNLITSSSHSKNDGHGIVKYSVKLRKDASRFSGMMMWSLAFPGRVHEASWDNAKLRDAM
jgi:hypothetical protein